jgi:hypothetical protein
MAENIIPPALNAVERIVSLSGKKQVAIYAANAIPKEMRSNFAESSWAWISIQPAQN